MSPATELMSWLRDAHAMEMQAIQMLENQARRIEDYPDLRSRILEHLEETRAQPAELAPSYVFLASTDSRYYTGEVFAPTGMQMTSR